MKKIISVLATMTVLAMGAQAKATNLVTNGGFETASALGQFNYTGGISVPGWYVPNGGYMFLGDAATVGHGGVGNSQYGGNIDWWAASNGGAGTVTASPNGGNFILSDGAYERQPLNQDISGLTVGQTYAVTYYYGAAQQTGYTGDTTDRWDVSLGGGAPVSTPTINLPSHTISGWTQATATFVATAANETLSFSAQGSPDGLPPFALLDGVTMNAVPEPGTWAMLIVGIGGIGAMARRRRAAGLSALAAVA